MLKIKYIEKFLNALSYSMFTIALFILNACVQEVPIQTTETDIHYDPLGEFEVVREAKSVDASANYLLTQSNQLYKTNGHPINIDWKVQIPLWAKGILPCKNGSVVVVTTSPFGYDLISFSRIGPDGNTQYSFPEDKLFMEFPNHFEHFINVCSDGQDGAYMLVALLEAGKYPDRLLKDEVFLVHLDRQNKITKISLNDYYVRIASDEQGNLFGLRFQERYYNIQAGGDPDSFYVDALDPAMLSQGFIAKTWSSGFELSEYYANYYWDMEFNLSVNSKFVYYAMPLARWVDIQYGHEMIALDRTSGKEVFRHTSQSPSLVDVYLSNTNLSGFANESGYFTQYMIGSTTRFLHMDMSGNLARHQDVKGSNNRCEILSLSEYNGDAWIWGIMSKGKNAQMVPFYQKMSVK